VKNAESILTGIALLSGMILCGAGNAALLEEDESAWADQEYKELPADEAGLAELYLRKADKLRVSWERLLIEERMAPTGRNTRDSIIRRYDDIVDRWPETTYAAQAEYNIITMYENTLDMTRVHHAYEKLLKDFPHSQHAMNAHLLVGLAFLDTLKNPSKAIRYFEAVPDPRARKPEQEKEEKAEASNDKDTSEISETGRRLQALEQYHVNAQLHLVKCHVYLEQTAQAERIINTLKERYPDQAERIDAAFVAIKADAKNLEKERKGVMKLLRILRR